MNDDENKELKITLNMILFALIFVFGIFAIAYGQKNGGFSLNTLASYSKSLVSVFK